MKRLFSVLLLVAAPVTPSLDVVVTSGKPSASLWREVTAAAQAGDASAKDAFEAAKELGTVEAWNAYLANFPTGFYADLARAYLQKLGAGGPVPPTAPVRDASPRPELKPQAGPGPNLGDLAPTDPDKPAVARGGTYMGFAERFNRYYTDPAWKPSRVV